MPTHRFPCMLWQDAAGFWTAVPVEADDAQMAGFGKTAKLALHQLRDYLTWLFRRNPSRPAPELASAKLALFKVAVRPEYAIDNRIHACEQPIRLPVHCVAGKLTSGLLVASLPLLNVRFYYHEPDSLKRLVNRYTQQQLKGMSPGELARFLPPPVVQLEDVIVRAVGSQPPPEPLEKQLPTLTQVAEPAGDRAVRKQYSAAWERGTLVQEVARRLKVERTNLLLVGEPGVGKTTVLLEAIQAVERVQAQERKGKDDPPITSRLFWATTAGRLIAGMKYLGQWEERCEKVIDEVARLPGVLVVDRLLDLVRVGGGNPTDSIAAFLLPYLQRGELRLVGEATPAELDACRRLLPGLIDLFPLMYVPPFDRTQAIAVLDRTAERQAQNLHIEVAPGVSARTYQLFCRFLPYQVFPGPAVGFLSDLCERQARARTGVPLTGENVTAHFVARTGLPDWLLHDDRPLDLDGMFQMFGRQVIGQEEAVRTAVQLVTRFKAGLNDPHRPLGVFLFCGPTGVGKTEMARAIARIMFGHAEVKPGTPHDDRLIRLDMSEYAGFDAVARLLGPPHGDPSALIRRVRRQPFCVLLLDEIEKASPDVFDTLLGVCDEGRLTDRFGRTTTFRSSVIIMTSNLGADRQDRLGLRPGMAPAYGDIAREFFRPEFFNRLDGVVTFQPLQDEIIHAIARKELNELAQREGFQRAGLRLRWSERLVGLLAREGFDVRYGARPLQRAIERRVVAPLARFLIARPELRDVGLVIDCNDREVIEVRQANG